MSTSDGFLSLFLDAKNSHELVVEIPFSKDNQEVAPAVTIDKRRQNDAVLPLLFLPAPLFGVEKGAEHSGIPDSAGVSM